MAAGWDAQSPGLGVNNPKKDTGFGYAGGVDVGPAPTDPTALAPKPPPLQAQGMASPAAAALVPPPRAPAPQMTAPAPQMPRPAPTSTFNAGLGRALPIQGAAFGQPPAAPRPQMAAPMQAPMQAPAPQMQRVGSGWEGSMRAMPVAPPPQPAMGANLPRRGTAPPLPPPQPAGGGGMFGNMAGQIGANMAARPQQPPPGGMAGRMGGLAGAVASDRNIKKDAKPQGWRKRTALTELDDLIASAKK